MGNTKNIGFIVQARTASVRFPNKIVREFYEGRSILEILIEKLGRFKDIPLIIATTKDPEDNIIEDTARNAGINYFRGSENNVLKRFIDAASEYKLDYIIRICSDNAFLDIDGLEEIIAEYKRKPVDYMSYILSGKRPSIKTHFGFWAEIVSLEALVKVSGLTTRKNYLEHVTSYIYTHPGEFKINFLKAPEAVFDRSDIRLTVDTEEDFVLQQELCNNLDPGNKKTSIEKIVDYLDNNEAILEKMKYQISQNSK